MAKPLCFVLMPFGKKPDIGGLLIDFDAVYKGVIKPAVEAVGLDPLRADEEQGGGIIHKPMFERLVLCPYAVADLTTANANVFYELGVRHAVRPASTVLLYAGASRMPFDVEPLRALPYKIEATGMPAEPEKAKEVLINRLREAVNAPDAKDSPLYQLLEDYPKVQHEKTDVFQKQAEQSKQRKQQLAIARRTKRKDAVKAVEEALGPIRDEDAAVVIDLFLAYRDVRAWDEMVSLVGKMSKPLANTVLVQEQLGLGLNRAAGEAREQGKIQKAEELSSQAEEVLKALIDARAPSSETCGILGRVYKDRWEAAAGSGDEATASGYLDLAIDTYRQGFESDWRDAYPGVNAVTLMTVCEEPDADRDRLLPVIRYTVERRIAKGEPDYWDWATLLELAVLEGDEKTARRALGKALPIVRARWEPETTLRNLRLIREARQKRGSVPTWASAIERELEKKAQTSGA
ncbi:MAG: DUF4071 domain-containing protein [Verrucomicrobia bacterium]|nr:DUF4071 domain-containing protein [Verrucomicrobiota bacterium]